MLNTYMRKTRRVAETTHDIPWRKRLPLIYLYSLHQENQVFFRRLDELALLTTYLIAYVKSINTFMEKQVARYKYRIYPNKEQAQKINQFCGAARWIWNEFLAKEIAYYKETKQFHWYKGIAGYIKSMKEENTWLKEIPSQIPQQVGLNLDKALKSKFKHGRGFPKFKKKRDGFGAFHIPQVKTSAGGQIRLHEKHIQLPKLGQVRIKLHRELPDKIKSATIIQDQDRYYVSVITQVDKQPQIREIPKTNAVGIDMGLTDFITTSDDEVIDNLKPFKKKQRRLKIRQRRLSRKTNKSNNRTKARKIVYRVHRKIREQRKDFHHKTANNLLKNYDLICVEDLNVKGLMRTKLAKSIQDTGWSSFKTILEYKAELLGKTVVSIGRFDPSSKTCNSCGNKKDMPLNIRVYKCECGHEMNRDLNAALNILDWGYKKYTVGTTEIYASQIRTNKTKKSQDALASSGEEATSSLDSW